MNFKSIPCRKINTRKNSESFLKLGQSVFLETTGEIKKENIYRHKENIQYITNITRKYDGIKYLLIPTVRQTKFETLQIAYIYIDAF
jgi:hypothetical protein